MDQPLAVLPHGLDPKQLKVVAVGSAVDADPCRRLGHRRGRGAEGHGAQIEHGVARDVERAVQKHRPGDKVAHAAGLILLLALLQFALEPPLKVIILALAIPSQTIASYD